MAARRRAALAIALTVALVAGPSLARSPWPSPPKVQAVAMAELSGGEILPSAAASGADAGTPIVIAPFRLDRRLITTGEFADFVQRRPDWRRSRIARLFAEPDYLKEWHSDIDPGDAAARARPVTRVSWFAARAYCADAGKRLPSMDEWEWAARSGDPDFAGKSLEWYTHPTPRELPAAGSTPPDRHGVRDLGGLVWEWIEDFNSEPLPEAASCGAGATGSSDRSNYAAFMRRAFRGSLRGNYVLANLGFRCAASLPGALP